MCQTIEANFDSFVVDLGLGFQFGFVWVGIHEKVRAGSEIRPAKAPAGPDPEAS